MKTEPMFQVDQVVTHNNGSRYIIVGTPKNVRLEATNSPAYAYLCPDSGLVYVREANEMEDGRFAKATMQPESTNVIKIYTDGACSPNPGIGGWGYYIEMGDGEIITGKGGKASSTNNKMEMTAVCEALKRLPKGSIATLYTDSKYVQQGITVWIHSWINRKFKTSTGDPVKNKKLWLKIHELAKQHTIEWKWVKGHGSNRGNQMADKLAVEGRLEIHDQLKRKTA